MKKSVSLILAAVTAFVTTLTAYAAAGSAVGAQSAGSTVFEKPANHELINAKYKTDCLNVKIHIENSSNFIPGNMVFGIYSPSGQFWGAQRIYAENVAADYSITFNVPEYSFGDTLYLKLFSGAQKIQYGNDFYKADELIPIDTYTYITGDGKRIYGNDCSISATPLSSRYVKAFANGWELYFKNPAKIINGTCYIPINEYLAALEMQDKMTYNKSTGSIEVRSGNHKVLFYLNGNDVYIDGGHTYTDNPPMMINGTLYVPFRTLVEGLGGTVTAKTDSDGILNVSAALRYEQTPEEFVNSKGIESRTPYLVWVSKKNFKVTVFTGSKNNWKAEKTFKCSIGAPSTPTITGQYEYFSKESRWTYPTYYVGPIMRFYKGYALHSTLLRYNGTSADGRLGMKISHGCVRLAPSDIQWMVDMVPLHTKIYVTNE